MGRLLRPTHIIKHFGFVLFFCIVASPVYAGLAPIEGFDFNSVTACSDSVTIDYRYQPAGAPLETFTVDIFDSTFALIASTVITAQQGASRTTVLSISPVQTIGSEIFIEFRGGGNLNETSAFVQDCSVPVDNEPPVLACHGDGRLDEYNCSSPIAIYVSIDDDGWMIQVWWVNENSVGEFQFLFYEEDLPEPGEEPILLVSNNGVSLYLLPTGELQLNAPYLNEPFKFYVYIFTMPDGDGYRADFP